jgi:LemA protein
MKKRGGVGAVLLGILGTIVLALVLGLVMAISGYNRAVSLDEGVRTAWAQVENRLQQRFDLIPNLVETVKGYATHERELLEHIADARTKYFTAAGAGPRDEQIDAAFGVERLLSRLLVLQERYPELKASEAFARLQDQLEGMENRLAEERRRYNNAVNGLNTYRRGFFGRFMSEWAGVREAKYFNPPEETAETPRVSFDRPAPIEMTAPATRPAP